MSKTYLKKDIFVSVNRFVAMKNLSLPDELLQAAGYYCYGAYCFNKESNLSTLIERKVPEFMKLYA